MEALGVISRIPKSWLLVLDNADDPNVDYGGYFPPGLNGTIIITSRNPDCSIHQTVGHMELEAMSTNDSVMLLFRAAKYTAHVSSSVHRDGQIIVKLLGGHTLALIQAGSYIGRGYCTLTQYPQHYENARQRLLQFQPNQARSRYGNVYATFEASAQQLESSCTSKGNLALRLLGVISFLHYTSLPIDIFEAAWAGARTAMDKSSLDPGTNLDLYTTDVIVQLLQIVSITSKVWDTHQLNEAFELLDSLALLKRDFTSVQNTLIYMHPLTHAWSKDRQSVTAQHTSWKRAGALIALSAHDIVWNPWNSIWRLHEDLLRAHIQGYVASLNGPYPAKDSSFLMQVQYRCAAILQRMRCDQDLESLLTSVEQRNEDIPSGALLPFAKYKARNLSNLGHCLQSIEHWKSIISIEQEVLDDSDYVLLVSRHELGSAYLDAGKALEAIDVFQDVIPKKQTKLPAEHGDLIASTHELGRAYLDAERHQEAIPWLEYVVNITARHFQPNHPDLLVSQHELGRAYLLNSQVDEAIYLFNHVITIATSVNRMPETHPNLLVTKRQLARAYQAAGRLQEAMDLLEGIAELQSTLPEQDPSRLRTQLYLAEVYAASKRP